MNWTLWYTFTTWLFFKHKTHITVDSLRYPHPEYFLRGERFRWLNDHIGPKHEAWRLERLIRNDNYYERIHFRKARDKTLYLLRWPLTFK